MTNKEAVLSCVDCPLLSCNEEAGVYPEFCLTARMGEEEKQRLLEFYEQEDNRRLADAANEAKSRFGKDTRVEGILEFARQLGAQKIGIATCISLMDESRVMAEILRRHGFTVYSVMCKVGSMQREQDIRRGKKMCNPIQQARYLNEMGTELNIVIGLCVGHDSLFYRYSAAPVTTLVAKDWALNHNPIRALREEELSRQL